MTRFILFLCSLVIPAIAAAMPIIGDVSNQEIMIHSSFSGTRLLIFGARNETGDIVIVLRGPEQRVIIRKKERVAGLWVNRRQLEFNQFPLFYRIAATRPLVDVRQFQLFEPLGVRHEILPNVPQKHLSLPQGLIYLLQQSNLYSKDVAPIQFMGSTLFKAAFDMPDNVPRGVYSAEIYLFNDGVLSGMQTIPIEVKKTGLDAMLYDAAHRHSLVYGLLAVLLAINIGMLANWLFRRT